MKSLESDVFIVGAGSAGIAAAVACSKEGFRTVLIEKNKYPGGKATSADVGTICGLFRPSNEGISDYVNNGFPKEFAIEIQQRSESEIKVNNDGLAFIPYDIQVFKDYSLELIQNHGIEFFNETKVISVQKKNHLISSVKVESSNQSFEIQPKYIIDTSGNAAISDLANLKMIQAEKYQSAAQVIHVKGFNFDDETSFSLSLRRKLLSCKDGMLNDYVKDISVVPGSLKESSALLKIPIPDGIDDVAENQSDLTKKIQSLIPEILTFLKTNISSLSDLELTRVAPELGIRVEKRGLGRHILNRQEVVECQKFTYGIANGSWPIEKWSQGSKLELQPLKKGGLYQIPSDCLTSLEIDNLYMAGRNISADEDAIASARVIGTCLATGTAAGMLVVGRLKNETTESAISRIQNYMFKNTPTLD